MIKDQTSRGAKLVTGLIVLAIVLASVGIGYIRFGGPLHRQNLLQDELLADILPPPAFVVEPYLHTTWVLADPRHASTALAELEGEHALFLQRKAYWKEAPVPDELRAQVSTTIGTADAFWAAIDARFIPALKAGNVDVMRQVHATELTPAYLSQHDAVARLVERSTAYRTNLMDRAYFVVSVLIGSFSILALIILAMIHAAARMIRNRVVAPLAGTAETMQRMAAGDYAQVVIGAERDDEIGMMAKAIAVFRSNGIARLKAERDQHAVVAALSAGLDCMARQNLEYRIDEAFPEGYEELRLNYNTAVDALASALRTVRVGSASVTAAIAEIRAASDDLAFRNEQQASSLAQTAQAMQGVTASVRETASGAHSVQVTINATHR